MTERLRMLFGEDWWARVSARLAHLPIEPVLLMRDGSLTSDVRAIDPPLAGFTAAWFSPELFAIEQDEAFLRLVLDTPTLRWMQSGRVGFDHAAFAALAAKGVRIAISKGPVPAIAEYVIAAVLDHFQRGPERRAAQVAQRWERMLFREVAGSRWVFVGFGEIGRETARRARALGADVTGVRRSGGTDTDVDRIVHPDAMTEALAAADVVILSVPLTAGNDGAYGADFFAHFAAQALFVNVGRGQLLDEAALRAALDAGRIAHAVLDVTRVEPLPAGEWQWTHPRVTLTAHTSGIGSGLIERTDALLVRNLEHYLADEPLLHELDPAVFG